MRRAKFTKEERHKQLAKVGVECYPESECVALAIDTPRHMVYTFGITRAEAKRLRKRLEKLEAE